MKKPYKIALWCLAAAALLAAGAAGTLYYLIATPRVALQSEEYIYIRPDDDLQGVMAQIKEKGHVGGMAGFELLSRHFGYDKRIKTGKYALRNGDSMLSLFRRLVRGEQTPVRVVLPPVRTVEQMAARVGEQLMLDSAQLMQTLSNAAYLARMGHTREELPALFVPDTYEFYWNTDANRFLARMAKEYHRFWDEERLKAAQAVGLTPVEVATLASIVDEESNYPPEKPVIAGLYLNRLRRGMLLQSDPTVKFALGDFARRRILADDLAADSPYNTYRYQGLPPGPIRIATVAAIESVLHPAEHRFLYMCAKDDFSGSHNFAVSLSEHNANARRYQAALNRRNIKAQ